MEQLVVASTIIGSALYLLSLYCGQRKQLKSDVDYVRDPVDVLELVTQDGTYISQSAGESWMDFANRMVQSKHKDWAKFSDPMKEPKSIYNPKPMYNNYNELI